MGSAQIDLILKKTLNTSQRLSKSFKNYLLYQFLVKPLTKIKTEESFNEVYNCLRNENLYFLIASCNLFEEISRKSIGNNNILKDFIKVKLKNSDKYYIVCKTVHKNIFVDSKNKNNLTEFRIYEYSS